MLIAEEANFFILLNFVVVFLPPTQTDLVIKVVLHTIRCSLTFQEVKGDQITQVVSF